MVESSEFIHGLLESIYLWVLNCAVVDMGDVRMKKWGGGYDQSD